MLQQSFNHDFGQLSTHEQEALTETVKALVIPELITGIEIHRGVGNQGKSNYPEGLDIDITYRTEDLEREVKPMEFLEPFALRVSVPRSQGEAEVISQTRNMGKSTRIFEVDDTKEYREPDTRYMSGVDYGTEDNRGRTFEEARRLKTTAKQRQQLRIRTKLQKQARKNNR